MSQIIATPQQLSELRDRVRAEQAAQKAAGHKQVRICMGAGCIASGAEQVKQSIEAELERSGVHDGVSVIGTGCLGPCSAGPTLMIDDVFYENVKPQDGSALVNEHVLRGQIVSRLTHRRPDGRKVANAAEMDFFKRQAKIVLRNCGVIDPQRIEDYIARDGYQALAKVVANNLPEEVIETMRVSGLRGRGGAGFPTWRKWKLTRESAGDVKFAVCNADEGDPGAFMDRSVLEGDPHSVIEGMAVAAHTIGASRGYIYVRAEYPLAVAAVEDRHRPGPGAGHLGQEHLRLRFRFRPGDPHGFRGLRLRRRDGPDDLDRRQSRRAAAPPAVPRPAGPVGQADAAEQRRDLRQRAGDHPQRRRVVCRATARKRAAAPRSSPWPARSRIPAWWKCPSACRWAI